jgi:flagellar basal-body rod protein FlgF
VQYASQLQKEERPMDTPGYVALTRQTGLLKEMQIIANNIANVSTSGFRKEGVVFSEMVEQLPVEGGSVAMAAARVRFTDEEQGGFARTNGTFDFAIEGDGYFTIETPNGDRLTRLGAFTPNDAGELVTADGHRLLDAGGASIFVPPDRRDYALANDGTLTADGQLVAQVGVVRPADPTQLIREDGVLFRLDGDTEDLENIRLRQGYLEKSNVDPVLEIARMIEVHRAYEWGQKFLDREDERIRSVVRTLGQNG